MKKILFVFGTRPEAIKMAPVIETVKKYPNKLKSVLCITGQHNELLRQVLRVFKIKPDYDLNIMKDNQTLFDSSSKILLELEKVLKKERPELVLVQGDTTTAFIASLAAFYLKIKVGHIEAGLRSYDKFHPFPEEINRRCVDVLADLYFAPTKIAKENLIKEGISTSRIFVTGNTIVDALNMVTPEIDKISIKKIIRDIDTKKKIILVTAHRRENFGNGLRNIAIALKRLEESNKDIEIIFPVHPNPNVINSVKTILTCCNSRIHLVKPLDYFSFLRVLKSSYLILSDSGGVQEEAPTFNKPVLILRKVTERPEILQCGLGKLVGTDKNLIFKEAQKILNKHAQNGKKIKNPFGDGLASARIVKTVINHIF